MPETQPSGPLAALPYILPLVVLAIIMIRGTRPRTLVIERLWIQPLMLMVLGGLVVFIQGAPSPMGMVLLPLALIAGAGLGWWRGRLTRLSVDPETHTVTSQVSPVGLALLGGIFLLRFGLRAYAMKNPGALHASLADITDAMLLIAVGLVCAQRLEVWIRARALIAEARAK
ncbi:MAG TPA: DUF1453 family protein [Phenylobacterium sp.]|mgnify:CR=1 FL=1|nr:DUF1453 family protein [Phenylobacterium sp.]HQP21520.1 DUF1453 family protein [Phenylobacterium sp.]